MSPPDNSRYSTALLRRAGVDADASQLADAIVAVWRDIDATLTPIIGARGFAALHGRSMHLAARDFPWLIDTRENGVLAEVDFGDVRRRFIAQPVPPARNAAGMTLRCFYDLLASMIGDALTERLVQAIWDNPFGGQAAQDVSV